MKRLSDICNSIGSVYTITQTNTKTEGKPENCNDYVCVGVYQVSESSKLTTPGKDKLGKINKKMIKLVIIAVCLYF